MPLAATRWPLAFHGSAKEVVRESILAGLVQNIGILALIQQLGPSYQSLLSHVRSHGVSLLQYELDTLGFDHLVLSARLLSHWGLPAGLCAAISIPPDEDRIADLTKSEQSTLSGPTIRLEKVRDNTG